MNSPEIEIPSLAITWSVRRKGFTSAIGPSRLHPNKVSKIIKHNSILIINTLCFHENLDRTNQIMVAKCFGIHLIMVLKGQTPIQYLNWHCSWGHALQQSKPCCQS